jgi:hypothetical protein
MWTRRASCRPRPTPTSAFRLSLPASRMSPTCCKASSCRPAIQTCCALAPTTAIQTSRSTPHASRWAAVRRCRSTPLYSLPGHRTTTASRALAITGPMTTAMMAPPGHRPASSLKPSRSRMWACTPGMPAAIPPPTPPASTTSGTPPRHSMMTLCRRQPPGCRCPHPRFTRWWNRSTGSTSWTATPASCCTGWIQRSSRR